MLSYRIKLIGLFLFLVLTIGCVKPFHEKIYVDIAPNETAFVLPLEGANKEKQKKFKSVDYLEEKKVATKRINIPTRWHKTGRLTSSGKWIPTVLVIKVDRSPVTREWVQNPSQGTSNKDDAMLVESMESIEWRQGVTISASISEEDAAVFLYHYAGKELSYILDYNIRSFAQDYLTKEFATFQLSTARTKKKEIFNSLFNSTREKFKKKGITIENMGAAGGMNYVDEEIQKSINNEFASERNAKAEINNRRGAQEFAKAAKARRQKMAIEVDLMNAQANLKRADKWDGKLPANIMPEGMAAGFIMSPGGQ